MLINNYQSTTNFNGRYSDYLDKIDEPDKIKREKLSECDLDSDDFFNFPDTFREDELFDEKRDSIYSDLPESEDDIPAPFLPQRVVLLDLNSDDMEDPAKRENCRSKIWAEQVTIPSVDSVREQKNKSFDTSERPYVILHKTGKKLYLEGFFGRKSVGNIHEKIEEKVAEGHDLSDTINIYHNAILKRGFRDKLSNDMAEEAFALLKKGRNLDYILGLMEKSKCPGERPDYEVYYEGTITARDMKNHPKKR